MNDELKELISHKLDVIEFLDIIGYELADLVDILGDEIEEHKQELFSACSWTALPKELPTS